MEATNFWAVAVTLGVENEIVGWLKEVVFA
jgi:hypothetical protein